MAQACSGGAAYEVADDLTITVNGQIPAWGVGSKQEAKLVQTWERWGGLISASCRANRVPGTWFAAIMSVESQGDPSACSPCQPSTCSFYPHCQPCCAFGLLQMIDMTARCYGAAKGSDLLGNPELSIELGARMLAELIYGPRKCASGPYGLDLVRIAAAYNGGSAKCTGSGTFGLIGQGDYSMNAVRYANTAARIGIPVWPSAFGGVSAKMVAGGMIALAGIAAAMIMAGRPAGLMQRLGL
jgi:hypothetical protein